jgi:rare lipoprotein A
VTAPPAAIYAAEAAGPTLSFAPEQAAPAPGLATGPAVTGTASWYRTGYRLHRTYSGQMLNNNALTAASTVLPMGTMVRVSRIDGSRSVVVRVNDRMPRNHRLIDLSEIAARDLGMMGSGITTVTVTPIEVASEP